jgi:hypothetical protein
VWETPQFLQVIAAKRGSGNAGPVKLKSGTKQKGRAVHAASLSVSNFSPWLTY